MEKIKLFRPNWGGEKERDVQVSDGDSYVKGTVFREAGRRRLHIEDINVRPQGRGLGSRLMSSVVHDVNPDEITGEVVDSRALKIRKKLGGSHTINDVTGRPFDIDEATERMSSGGVRKVFVKTKLR